MSDVMLRCWSQLKFGEGIMLNQYIIFKMKIKMISGFHKSCLFSEIYKWHTHHIYSFNAFNWQLFKMSL